MYVVCVTIYVKTEYQQDFIKATLDNAKNTRSEPMNLRFDFLQHTEVSNQFFLYEVYKDQSGFDAHKQTEHYQRWRDTVESMMEKPREGVKYKNIFPVLEKSFVTEL
ncbi:MAG: putative quinol monooxygenase [Candidatus Thorarchaeota archaeon]